MSEDFLARWSRRKQAAAETAEPAKVPPDEGASQNAADASRDSPVPVLDPASLPALESITADTDIRAFFAAGVPAELTRAALRRAWTSDPKIRDFVGLADYDWDFNQPGSMAGFGPLAGADALRAQMSRRLGPHTTDDGAAEMSDRDPGAKQEALGAKQEALPSDDSGHGRPNQQTQVTTEDEPSQEIDPSQPGDEPAQFDPGYTAVQQPPENPEDVQSIPRRRHGRALPKS
jgi:hypothetical protein